MSEEKKAGSPPDTEPSPPPEPPPPKTKLEPRFVTEGGVQEESSISGMDKLEE